MAESPPPAPRAGIGHRIDHGLHHQAGERFVAVALELLEGFGVEVGVHEVGSRVVDRIELEGEVELVLEEALESADGVIAGLAGAGGAMPRGLTIS